MGVNPSIAATVETGSIRCYNHTIPNYRTSTTDNTKHRPPTPPTSTHLQLTQIDKFRTKTNGLSRYGTRSNERQVSSRSRVERTMVKTIEVAVVSYRKGKIARGYLQKGAGQDDHCVCLLVDEGSRDRNLTQPIALVVKRSKVSHLLFVSRD